MTCIVKMDSSSAKALKDKHKRNKFSVDHSLRASLRQAAAQRRLTVGLDRCISLLKRSPEKVMVCLLLHDLPATAKDLTIHKIQHVLLKAFCAENRINTVQVTADLSFLRLVCQVAGKACDNITNETPADCSLMVIEYPSGEPSREDLAWAAACQNGQLDIRTKAPWD